MAKKPATPDVVKLIRRIAATPEFVEVYETAVYDFMGVGFTKEDLCEAICEWVDDGREVRETTIKNIRALKGQPAYELKPRLAGRVYYVKLSLEKRGDDWLLILSAHLDERG